MSASGYVIEVETLLARFDPILPAGGSSFRTEGKSKVFPGINVS